MEAQPRADRERAAARRSRASSAVRRRLDLDRVIDAFNERARRADRLQQQADELRTRLAQAERFGMLGKLAAQVAHEIRNPMGAMRLKAENALAGDGRRQRTRCA